MIEHYDYLKQNLRNASPLVTQWAQSNDITMLDFDNCLYDVNFDNYCIRSYLKHTKENYSGLAIVECHPFFENDELYTQRRNTIVQIAHDLNLDYFFLRADYSLWLDKPESNKTFYPDWYFRQRQWSTENNHITYNFDKPRNYNFSCGNKSNLRIEKIYNYIECYRRHREDWYITIYDSPQHKISESTSENFPGLSDCQKHLWDSEIRQTIKEYENDVEFPDIYFTHPHSLIFPVHTNSYCNLVMEHSMEIAILSEKSYKPFIAKQIPIYLAGIGAANALKNLGFDLFYDFIDHTLYDNLHINNHRDVQNFAIRINRVHELIDDLYKTNFTDFFHDSNTKQRLQSNQDYFFSDEIDKLTIKHLDKLVQVL
jgi:hypothetical protein